MTADLTREEIERRLHMAPPEDGVVMSVSFRALSAMQAAVAQWRSEPARLAAARAEGVREGLEIAARYHEGKADVYQDNRAQFGFLHTSYAAEIRALSPAPAEAPTTPAVEGSDGWIVWCGGFPPVDEDTLVKYLPVSGTRLPQTARAGDLDWPWNGPDPSRWPQVYRIVKPAEARARPWPGLYSAAVARGYLDVEGVEVVPIASAAAYVRSLITHADEQAVRLRDLQHAIQTDKFDVALVRETTHAG